MKPAFEPSLAQTTFVCSAGAGQTCLRKLLSIEEAKNLNALDIDPPSITISGSMTLIVHAIATDKCLPNSCHVDKALASPF